MPRSIQALRKAASLKRKANVDVIDVIDVIDVDVIDSRLTLDGPTPPTVAAGSLSAILIEAGYKAHNVAYGSGSDSKAAATNLSRCVTFLTWLGATLPVTFMIVLGELTPKKLVSYLEDELTVTKSRSISTVYRYAVLITNKQTNKQTKSNLI